MESVCARVGLQRPLKSQPPEKSAADKHREQNNHKRGHAATATYLENQTYKVTGRSKVWHSLSISSSHTHNWRLHSQAAPPTSQPKEYISATVFDLVSAKSNRRLHLSHKRIPPNQESYQNNVSVPSPPSSSHSLQTFQLVGYVFGFFPS
jgi:hypothetical protein